MNTHSINEHAQNVCAPKIKATRIEREMEICEHKKRTKCNVKSEKQDTNFPSKLLKLMQYFANTMQTLQPKYSAIWWMERSEREMGRSKREKDRNESEKEYEKWIENAGETK